VTLQALSVFIRMLDHECTGYTEDAATFLDVLEELTQLRDMCLLTGRPIAILLTPPTMLGAEGPKEQKDVF
jgi:hypothetical protein